MTDREIFQENINRLIEQSGITQQYLAECVGVERSTVSAWARGKAYPRADTMEKLAIVFGINLSDLVLPKEERDMERRLLRAWRTAEPTYQTVALELLESHHILQPEEKASIILEREGFFDKKGDK